MNHMLKMVFSSLCLLTTCCGTPSPYFETEELFKLSGEFVYRAEHEGRSRRVVRMDYLDAVRFGKVEGADDVVAQCELVRVAGEPLPGMSRIIIDRVVWHSLTPCDRRLILFHELAHCTLLEGHVSGLGEMMSPLAPVYRGLDACEDILLRYFTGSPGPKL